jgi:hypothetical protein
LLAFVAQNTIAQTPLAYELEPYQPLADSKAIIVSGKARFTVLTNSLIRFEYDSNEQFEDRATIAFVNRLLTVPTFNKNS